MIKKISVIIVAVMIMIQSVALAYTPISGYSIGICISLSQKNLMDNHLPLKSSGPQRVMIMIKLHIVGRSLMVRGQSGIL